jgi:hypothetical protein
LLHSKHISFRIPQHDTYLDSYRTLEEFDYTTQAYEDFKNFYTALEVDSLSPTTGGAIKILITKEEVTNKLNIILQKLQLDEKDNASSYCYRAMFRDFPLAFPDFGPILVEYAFTLGAETEGINMCC